MAKALGTEAYKKTWDIPKALKSLLKYFFRVEEVIFSFHTQSDMDG